jgi:hypothetical protein
LKFGDSLGVILPKELLQRLNAAEGECLLLIESADGAYELGSHHQPLPQHSSHRRQVIGLSERTTLD